MRDHVVLCGSDVLAARVLEELGALGVDVVVIAQDPDRRWRRACAGSAWSSSGRTVGEAEAELELRVLARDDAWWPPGPTPIEPDSRLLVLASREGLAAAYGTGR